MLKLGNKIISDLYLGDKRIAKAFLGEKLVYEKISGQPIFLDYIETDSNSYIDTGIALGINHKVSVKVKAPTSSSSAIQLFGNYSDSAGYFTCNIANSSGAISRFDGATYTGNISRSDDNFHTYIIDKSGIVIDTDTKLNWNKTPTDFQQSDSFYLFRARGSSSVTPSGTQISEEKVWENDILIQDLRPCLHPKTLKVCMYDMVTKKYFYNQGTGSFIAGNKINFVDYISFDGNSWIDVDYAPTSNTRVVGKFSITAFKGVGANYVFGVFGDNANYGLNIGSNRQILNIPWASFSAVAMNNPNNLNQIYSFDISKNGAYLDGILKLGASQLSATFTATKTFFVGWANGTSTDKLIGDVYPMQMYENDVLVKDLRPCVINNVVGLYDMVTGKFHTNIGTGMLKVPHIELDYIITDSNNYIDTEYYPNENTYIEYTWETIKAPTANYNGLFGSRVGTSTEEYHVFLTSGLNLRLDFGRYAEPNVDYKTALNTKYTIKAGLGEIYINDELVKSYTPKTGQTKNSMYLGNFNNNGTSYATGVAQKIYPCTIYENGVLVRNFKPCIVSDGQVAMYDEVNNKYHYGQGNGEIKAGGRFVESILFDGASWIDTGIVHQTCTVETTIRFEENGTRQLMGFGSSTAQYWGKPANSVIIESLGGSDVTDKTDVIIEYNCDDSTAPTIVRKADGKTSAVSTGKTVGTMPYIIGALVWGNSATTNGYHCTCEVWNNKIIINGEVIQDLRPYVDEDGIPCFYDMVTNVKFYNKGTGTLSYTE